MSSIDLLKPKGFILDFDGLIIDTEYPVFSALAELFSQFGHKFTFTEYSATLGTDRSVYDPVEHIRQLSLGKLSADEIVEITLKRTRELVDLQPLLPGVLEFLQKASDFKIPIALASSSSRAWVEGYLNQRKIRAFFKVVTTSDDVSNVKPAPELFLLAAKKLGVATNEVVVFEDSPNGVLAAKAAGIYCIAIPNQITKNLDLSKADKIITSFADFCISEFFIASTKGENDIL